MTFAECIGVAILFVVAVFVVGSVSGKWLGKCTPPQVPGRTFGCLDCGEPVASPLLICPDREACADRQMERINS